MLVIVLMSYNYSLKLERNQIKIQKNNQAIRKELAEVERVNGKEKKDIKELQEKMKQIEKKISHE